MNKYLLIGPLWAISKHVNSFAKHIGTNVASKDVNVGSFRAWRDTAEEVI